ncbi:indole-3-acetic acid-induced protein ARG7-like [Senna tora]|uniref:Indole-3-acetic acid-induced protein ARG7-like n=1 Tax=Senna tora TaxID=362788 RepID=A0A834WFA7_9FABA|nr:indole-3-acetic acid-induced protein ARG7-like [Senna tora]
MTIGTWKELKSKHERSKELWAGSVNEQLVNIYSQLSRSKLSKVRLTNRFLCLSLFLQNQPSMADSTKKIDKIHQIVRLKQMFTRWKLLSLGRRSLPDRSNPSPPTPPGFFAVYVGLERKRFVIPARFLKLPIFQFLLEKAEEEFGYQSNGGLVLPCDVSFFAQLVYCLHRDEHRYRKYSFDDFVKLFSDAAASDSCKEKSRRLFTPLLQKTKA